MELIIYLAAVGIVVWWKRPRPMARRNKRQSKWWLND